MRETGTLSFRQTICENIFRRVKMNFIKIKFIKLDFIFIYVFNRVKSIYYVGKNLLF